MEAINKFRTIIASIDTKEFYKYIILFFLGITLITGIIIFQYYKKVGYLKKRINNINELREIDVKTIREKSQRVQLQREEVNTLPSEDENFKIGGYFTDLINSLQLTDKKIAEEKTEIDRDDTFREIELNAKFEDMNTKQLAQLLQKIEETKRIFIKKLEIVKSTKQLNSIEVTITIATLLPETELTE